MKPKISQADIEKTKKQLKSQLKVLDKLFAKVNESSAQ
jgi:hypothetical protein